ncbi:hypothetical protein F9C11_20400 [Amycolatopsis sp. VS8301801F10]|uniref:hypothetical protein n=1 Tax=unclassified Amycolatopsis TaxID=2618356 RepID=UPI0038FBE596
MTTTGRPHGRAKYVMEHCKCDVCTQANRDYNKHQKRQRAYGRPAYIDAEPARQHLRALSEAGIGWRRAAKLAGLHDSIVKSILFGRPGRVPNKRIRAATAERIFAVKFSGDALADKAVVDITGSRRRLQALVATGRTQQYLADRLGMTPGNFWLVMQRQTRITAAKQRQINALYDELWDTPPADDVASRHARAYARRHGWVPPLAWDDDTIDDPDAEPVGVEESRRRPGGQPKLPPADELRWLLTQQSRLSVAQRYGVRPDAIDNALRRSA